ncbi:DUF5107 domain-containing protein [Pedobacter sp. SYP-B3415]|uniref:DUF5107 domain-containing protein n=1 Tax=Pedobacter sp. SYP-B3415 TaxID=2496641 RepID=UPI00101BABA2|nr:DUF5107 domain-containing protein [Pedobacter sp. SYP-B3415]
MQQFTAKAWEEKVTIPTYGIGKAEKNPMFFEKRVYQGSSGAVYPNPVIEKILDEKQDRVYKALFLENKYLKIMLLPELGGRVQMAYDKIKQRHFVYHNQVIKPALVGLTGPWVSGGIEFNWPQHHRPSTFEPVDYDLSQQADGSATVWINEVEKMSRTKGLVAFTLHPDKAYLEISAQIYNRTNLPQTFLWWANPAVKVNDHYQSVFPPDVNAVFDHGKRDVSAFPIATGTYYKVNYAPGTDISRYKNIPVPTSYMAINSAYDFMGGYEHDTQAGMLHVADHHISPGKKQWTWGYGDFGRAWDRNLTDEDGPYIELMAGCFTDNQPDFTWLMPYETKIFTQYFLPYRELGLVKNANKDLQMNLEVQDGIARIKIQVTSVFRAVAVTLTASEGLLYAAREDLDPETVFNREIAVPGHTDDSRLILLLRDAEGNELMSYLPGQNAPGKLPQPASAALPASQIDHIEQLFLTGQHLEQYRHATYDPLAYYNEGLRRDPGDYRCNTAVGTWYVRRGRFDKSIVYFSNAIQTITSRNPNPYDGEAYYGLGLALKYIAELDSAYSAFYKATWCKAFQDTGFFALAQIDLIRKNYRQAVLHAQQAISGNAANSKAYVLHAAALRHLGQLREARSVAEAAVIRDRFNLGAIRELAACCDIGRDVTGQLHWEGQLKLLGREHVNSYIEYALDYAAAGLFNEAVNLLEHVAGQGAPMVFYHLAYCYERLDRQAEAVSYLSKAALADPYLCFPSFLEDIAVLSYASQTSLRDAKAPYYLGNLWYDKRQYDLAIENWMLAVQRDDAFPTVYRNLGIAAFNKRNAPTEALAFFEKSFELDPTDARVLMELDQLRKRMNVAPQTRLQALNQHLKIVELRDDLYLERLSLYNFLGDHDIAYELIMSRKFHPWEGGEGKVSRQYVLALVSLARENIMAGRYTQALRQLNEARVYPHHIGEGKLPGVRENDLAYFSGLACEAMGEDTGAMEFFRQAALGSWEPGAAMFYNDQQPDQLFYQGLAYRKLQDQTKARQIFERLITYGESHINDEIKIDYFAVSLPNLLIFEDDLRSRNQAHCLYLKGLGHLGLQQFEQASASLQQVLKIDAMHFGAHIHLVMSETETIC